MQNEKINALLIEDNPDDALLLQASLEDLSGTLVNVEWVDRLSTGVERIEQGGIDIVLLDLSLPDGHGIETVSTVCTHAPDLPVVVLTGLNDIELSLAAVREGAQDYLVKGEAEGELLVRSMRYAIEREKTEQALRASEESARQLAHENMVMAEIGRIIGSSLEINEVYERFASQVRRLVHFDRIDIALANSDDGVVTQAYFTGTNVSGRSEGDRTSIRGTMTEELVNRKTGMLFDSSAERERVCNVFPGLVPAFDSGLRSWAATPLISGDSVFGGLFLSSKSEDIYRETDLKIIQRVGDHIASAIANAQLYEERTRAEAELTESLDEKQALLEEIQLLYSQERHRADQMKAINELGVTVSSILSLDELLPFAVNLIRDSFNYYSVLIALIAEDSGRLMLMSGAGRFEDELPIGSSMSLEDNSMSARVAKTGRLMLANDVSKEPLYKSSEVIKETRSELTVPILIGESVVGVLDVQSKDLNAFDDGDVSIIQILANQLAVAIENARLFEESKDLAVLGERNRMAREMHDTLAQGFTGIVLQLEAAEESYEKGFDEITDHLVKAKALARECLQEARRSVWNLLPQALENKSLESALQNEVRQFNSVGREKAQLSITGDRHELSPDVQAAILRILQESLTNVRKHADALAVWVDLAMQSDCVYLRVRDDGKGIVSEDVEKSRSRQGGFGMLGMEQRILHLRGTFTVESAPGKGTQIEVVVPID